ncbi:MAG: hypothetical protein VYA39_00680 [Candidatus Thermoplasmatota archaeon]|nr:hypothetical protein [Candidatus Thermoplasmatota archaeon]RAH06691.1 MAG: hypothetical protein CMA00_001595 [Euryarchaeota archaeon]
MSDREGLPDWVGRRARMSGSPNREVRFEKAARAIANSVIRNRPISDGGSGCPVIVEGPRDEDALRELGFTGPVEKVNRGWDRSTLIAYLHSTYCLGNVPDDGPPVILLMDWDRTGGKLQSSIRDRMMAMDSKVDESLRKALLRSMKPEGRTVESLIPHAHALGPIIQQCISELD